MSASYEWTCADEAAALIVENEALQAEIDDLRKSMTLVLNEYHEVRTKYHNLCDRLGKDHYLTR